MKRALLVTLCGCRWGFELHGDAAGPTADRPIDAASTTITFGERPTSMRTGVTRDARLDQSAPAMNYGAAEDLSLAEFAANAEHALLRFELSSLAPGTRIVAARLSLMKLDYGDETPGPLEMRLLGEDWVEGTNNGTAGTGASWATRDGSAPWMTAGGSTTQMLATVTPSAQEILLAIDPLVVQAWVDAPATNAGVLLTVGGTTAHYHFHSRNSNLAGGTARPELALDIIE